MRKSVTTAPAPGADPLEFVMSDSKVDRQGDLIEASGWTFDKMNTIALFNHDPYEILGTWKNIRIEGKRLIGALHLADESTSKRVREIRSLIEQGILRNCSVGFQATEKEPLTKEADEYFGPFRFLKQDLLECSLVAVPANPRAVALAKSLGVSSDTMAEVFEGYRKPAVPSAEAVRAKTGVPSPQPSTRVRTMTMHVQGTLSQRIQAAQDNFKMLQDRMKELSEKDGLDAEEAQRASELPDEIAAIRKVLDDLLKQERAAAGILEQKSAGDHTAVTIVPKQEVIPARASMALYAPNLPVKKIEPVDYVFRSLSAWAMSNTLRDPPEKIMREHYGNDEITNVVLRSAVNPAMTTVAGWAAELVRTAYGNFLDRLLPKSIYAPLSAAGSRFTFGNFGQIKIPTRTLTSTLAGSWVGEGNPKPVRKASFSSITLNPYKLSIISTFTEEMAQYSTPTIEGIIQKAMQDDTSISLDTYLIDANAASATRPAGLLNGVTPITPSAAATPAQAMIADLKALIAALVAQNAGVDVIILLNPMQAMGIMFSVSSTGEFLFSDLAAASAMFGVRFVVSNTVPAGRVIAIEAGEFTTATGDTPRFAVSNEATLHEEDTTPLALAAVGSPNTVAAPMRSLFQTDAIAIRMSLYVSWAMRRPNLVQTISPVIW